MPSPFPGMDPYLEDPAFWQGFHGELIYACRARLLNVLPPDYDADVGEQLRLVEADHGDDAGPGGVAVRDVVPDVAVTGPAGVPRPRGGGGGAATLDVEPVTIPVPTYAEFRQRWIAVRHLPERSLVTAIEVLSPTNKSGDGFGEYQSKRRALLRQNVNTVEIDLLLGGRRAESGPGVPRGDYYAIVSRAQRPGERDVFAWPVRRPIPRVPVPLREPHDDVVLDLAGAFADAFDRGGYARRLRYDAPPRAPLGEDDRAWASEVVARRPAARNTER